MGDRGQTSTVDFGEIGDAGDKLTFLLNLPIPAFIRDISAAYGMRIVNYRVAWIPPKPARGAVADLVTSSILLDCGCLHHTHRY
jgi:hypothetical protein